MSAPRDTRALPVPADDPWRMHLGLVACVPFLLLALAHRADEPSVFSGDWAQYVAHARALAEGRAYTDIGYLYSPLAWTIGPRAYPPGLPLTLLPLVGLGAWALPAMRVLMVLSAVGFLLMSGRRLGTAVGGGMALLTVAWVGVMLELDRASVQVLSDLGFCFMAWWAIAEVDAPGPWTRGRTVRVLLAFGGAIAYRVVGVALPAALGVYLLLAPRDRRRPVAIIVGMLAMAGVAGLLVAPQLVPRQFLANGLPSPGGIVRQLLEWRHPLFDLQGYPFPVPQLNDAWHVLATLLLVVGAVSLVRREGRSLLTIFALVYGALLLLVRVFDLRYFWPLFPLMAVAQVEGLFVVLGALRLAVPARRRVMWALSALVLAACAWRGTREPAVPGFSSQPDALAVMDSARAQLARGAAPRYLFANPRVLTLETGVPAMGMVTAPPSALVKELIRLRITHVVLGAFRDGCGPRSLARARDAWPASFPPGARVGRFEIIPFTPPDSAALARPAVADRSPGDLGDCGGDPGWEIRPGAVSEVPKS